MTSADPPNDPLALLWKIARAWLADAIHAFGPPAEVAAILAGHARRAVKRRIKALETLVMKLLLIEASRLTFKPARRERRAAAPASPPSAPPPLDLARPETWRVHFVLRIPAPQRPPRTPRPSSGPRIRDLGRPLLVRDIWRDQVRDAHMHQLALARAARFIADEPRERARSHALARRFEALKRVIANPAPYARRLLLKLNAHKHAYDAAMRVAMRPPPRKQLNPVVFQNAEFHACTAVAAVLAPARMDSS